MSKRLPGFVLSAVLGSSALAAEPVQQIGSTSIQMQMDYLIFKPKTYSEDQSKPVPLLIFLHGSGESGHDLNLVKKWGPPSIAETNPDFPFLLVSPQAPEPNGWNIPLLKAMLDDVLAKYNVDRSRVYLTGLSMGGFGA